MASQKANSETKQNHVELLQEHEVHPARVWIEMELTRQLLAGTVLLYMALQCFAHTAEGSRIACETPLACSVLPQRPESCSKKKHRRH